MMRRLLSIICVFCAVTAFASSGNEKIKVSDDIEIVRLTDYLYIHRSFLQTQNWGKVGANGLILIKDNKALLVDTPWNNEQTEELYKWISETLHATVETVIPTHWHADRMGGLAYLQSKGVRSYANNLTIELAESKGLPVPETGFKDSLSVHFHGTDIMLFYLGGGHTTDNIVVYLPSDNILFGGCLIKDAQSKNLGNLEDADVEAWPSSIGRVEERFGNVKTVIPGHGDIGDSGLLKYTLKLMNGK